MYVIPLFSLSLSVSPRIPTCFTRLTALLCNCTQAAFTGEIFSDRRWGPGPVTKVGVLYHSSPLPPRIYRSICSSPPCCLMFSFCLFLLFLFRVCTCFHFSAWQISVNSQRYANSSYNIISSSALSMYGLNSVMLIFL